MSLYCRAPQATLFLLMLVWTLAASATSVAPDLSCEGRRIFVHDLPAKFNRLLLLQAQDYLPQHKQWFTEQMLRVLERINASAGFGEAMKSPVKRPLLPEAWYKTDQFALEVIFHARMRYYPCTTEDYEEADLVYVPYYGGLDMTRHMHDSNAVKETLAKELAHWLQRHPAWEKEQGRDHFWVLGRETWDFRKNVDGIWGNNLLNLPGINGSVITVDGETSPWYRNDFCAPKPTGFHPATRLELDTWLGSVRAQPRPYLFSFIAGRRKNTTAEGRLREKLFWQCGNSSRCFLGDCDAAQVYTGTKWVAGCESPRFVMRGYLKSSFCLHPRGDSCNRRSVLDSMLAGCIPVVFETCTLQEQYGWHVHSGVHDLGGQKFFVHIPHDRVRGASDAGAMLLVEDTLRRIPKREVAAMRQKVLELVPRITFGGRPMQGRGIAPPDFRDAFDIIIDGLVQARNRNVMG